ncbi:MAG: hypothetical protein JXR86_07270 [Spirochaetales bacterium]|nr:hypothetical protein [Spirochaetales bacterium]
MYRLFHPHVYQGPLNFKHRKGYFEGWYYKFVTKENRSLAFIPGISLGKDESRAFIQIIDGKDGSTEYINFPLDQLELGYRPFSVTIGGNRFSLTGVELSDTFPFKGQIAIKEPSLYPVSFFRPGIMGWYRYVPFMECYHGVVSTGHKLSGTLMKDGETIDLEGGSGYIEKDWGTSFPSSYIWMQTNSFARPRTSFMLSLARIPWFGSWFRGFLGYLVLEGELITFSTYTGARTVVREIGIDRVSMTIHGKGRGRKGSLKKGEVIELSASRKIAGELKAPVTGSMDRRISESIDGRIHVKFFRKDSLLFEEESPCSGLEIVGDRKELL